jgi:hypothetical protein
MAKVWTIRKTNNTKTVKSEILFMRHTAGYILFNHEINYKINTELQISPIADIQHYKGNWREDVEGMRHPKIIKYQHRGRIHPLYKEAKFYFVIFETGLSGPNTD